MRSKSGIVFILVCIVLSVFYASVGFTAERVTIDMSNLGKAWQDFMAKPGPDTALAVYNILPDGKEHVEIELQGDVRTFIAKNLNVLESRIYAGDRNALKAAFRLFLIADVEMSRTLYSLIGYLLRFNTVLFLEECQEHQHLVPELDLLVCSFRLTVPAEEKGQLKLEKNIRLKALEYIQDKKFKALKKKCIKILKKFKV
ncbi:MAG: hypothetical protein GY765_41540 [bacterium]|nr:hypothetical protein [bacterium]